LTLSIAKTEAPLPLAEGKQKINICLLFLIVYDRKNLVKFLFCSIVLFLLFYSLLIYINKI